MISENKLKHSIEVARECRKLARQKGHSKDICNAMFIMGLLHDVGCEDNEISEHPYETDILLTDFNKHFEKCINAIAALGLAHDNWSEFDTILNLANMTISQDGSKISIEEQLSAIAEKWGSDSAHYRHALETSAKLRGYSTMFTHMDCNA